MLVIWLMLFFYSKVCWTVWAAPTAAPLWCRAPSTRDTSPSGTSTTTSLTQHSVHRSSCSLPNLTREEWEKTISQLYAWGSPFKFSYFFSSFFVYGFLCIIVPSKFTFIKIKDVPFFQGPCLYYCSLSCWRFCSAPHCIIWEELIWVIWHKFYGQVSVSKKPFNCLELQKIWNGFFRLTIADGTWPNPRRSCHVNIFCDKFEEKWV